MVKTDFVLSFLTNQVNDDLLKELINREDVDFTIAEPDDYWSKQQIKDAYKTPDGGYNREKFLEDYKVISTKFENFEFQKFANSFFDSSPPKFQDGGTLSDDKTKVKSKRTISDKELERSALNNIPRNYYDTKASNLNSDYGVALRAFNTNKGKVLVPDAYTEFTDLGYSIDLAKGKTLEQLAEENSGLLDEKGNLIEQSFLDKVLSPLSSARKVVIVNPVTGKVQDQILKSGENVNLALKNGVDSDGNIILDRYTAGETLFGPQKSSTWSSRTEESDWIGMKPVKYATLTGEHLLKGAWNTIFGIGSGITEAAKVANQIFSEDGKAASWLQDIDNFMEAQSLRSDKKTTESSWGSALGFTSQVSEGIGQLAGLAALTIGSAKLGKKVGMNDKAVQAISRYGTATAFALWGAEDIDDELAASGIDDPNKRAAIYALTVGALAAVNTATNFFEKQLPANVQKELVKNAIKNSTSEITELAAKKLGDKVVSEASKSILKNLTKGIDKYATKAAQIGKTKFAEGFIKEGIQETTEEIIPDITSLAIPRLWNRAVDGLELSPNLKYNFNEYGELNYNDFISGKNFERYIGAGIIGGVSGGVGNSFNRTPEDNKNKVDYIQALTINGSDFSEQGITGQFNKAVEELNDLKLAGKLGPNKIGLDLNYKKVPITEKNRGTVQSINDLIYAQAVQDLTIVKDSLLNISKEGGALHEMKKRWELTNKAISDPTMFNKFGLTFAQKRIANSYLMDKFKKIITSKDALAVRKTQLNQIAQRNQLLLEGKTQEAQELQNQIEGGKSKNKLNVNDKESLAKFDLLREQKFKGADEEYRSLLNGNAFMQAMQLALTKTQVNLDNIKFNDNGFIELSHPLDVFGDPTSDSSVFNFNNLNMTSESIFDLINSKIDLQNEQIKQQNNVVKEGANKILLDNGLNSMEELDTMLEDLFALAGTEEVDSEIEKKIELKNSITDQESKVLPLIDKLIPSNTPYLNRVDTKKFVSLESSIKNYIDSKTREEQTLKDKFLDNNLESILNEIDIRIAQVKLNYGANRKMSELESNILPFIAELYQTEEADLEKEYFKLKDKFSPIKLGEDKVSRKGSNIYMSIQSKDEYESIVKELENLKVQALKLKAISDANKPDIDVIRQVDDLVYIKGQFQLFSNLLSNPQLSVIYNEISDMISVDGKLKEGRSVDQNKINDYVSSLNEAEVEIHKALNQNDQNLLDNINTVKAKIEQLGSYLGYEKDEFNSYINNLKQFNTYEFYEELSHVSVLDKIPSFTQIESAKQAYWNLRNEDNLSPNNKINLSNFVGLFGYQGSGKTSVVANLVTQLYLQNTIIKTEGDFAIERSEIKGYTYLGKKYKGSPVFEKEDPDTRGYFYKALVNGKFVNIKDSQEQIFTTDKRVVLAAKYSHRISDLENSLPNVGFERVDLKNNKVSGDENTTDFIEKLIESLESGIYNDKDLIIIDEATILGKDQLIRLKNIIDKINQTSRPIPLKVLMLGDLKQSGDLTGLQGEYKEGISTTDNTGNPTIDFTNSSRSSDFYIRKGKELRVRFRAGVQSINSAIDFFRNKGYEEGNTYHTEYYQGSEGLKGNKVSNDLDFEIENLKLLIRNNKIKSSDFVIITTADRKQTISLTNPELTVLTIEEAQGKTFKGVIFAPSPNYVYSYALKIDDKYKLTKNQPETNYGIIQSSFFNKFRDENGSVQYGNLAIGNLNYQLGFDTISALGRAQEYTCLVIEKNHNDKTFGVIAQDRLTSYKNSVKHINDISVYDPTIKPTIVRKNKSLLEKLTEVESSKFTSVYTEKKQPTKTKEEAIFIQAEESEISFDSVSQFNLTQPVSNHISRDGDGNYIMFDRIIPFNKEIIGKINSENIVAYLPDLSDLENPDFNKVTLATHKLTMSYENLDTNEEETIEFAFADNSWMEIPKNRLVSIESQGGGNVSHYFQQIINDEPITYIYSEETENGQLVSKLVPLNNC